MVLEVKRIDVETDVELLLSDLTDAPGDLSLLRTLMISSTRSMCVLLVSQSVDCE